MEQYSHYLMWMKSKHHHNILNSSHFQAATTVNSWEEQAFAEDANGPLGGFVWPPRSYSCSFCKREFRSAQALGGHMNVHRRDRARLKQSNVSSPQNEVLLLDTSTQFLSQVCSSDSNPSDLLVTSPPRENFSKKTNASHFSLTTISQGKENDHFFTDSRKVACKSTTRGEESHEVEGHVETNLSIGLSFSVSRSRLAGEFDGDRFKRRKTSSGDGVFQLPFLLKPCSNDKDIDLELRLGDSSIVQ